MKDTADVLDCISLNDSSTKLLNLQLLIRGAEPPFVMIKSHT